ncbi:MAG: CheY-like chemotaxis protein [Verrucomicrobiales bacterium]|jgi:CheY-like chemotaxis protein
MSKKRVLLVDDEVALTKVVKINLEATGKFEVEIENLSGNAVAKAKEFQPDIILLDIVMPGMDGGDVKRLIKQSPALQDTHVIFLTALVEAGDTNPGAVVQSGDDIMIGKPVTTDQLVRAIEDKLAGRI